MQKFYQLKFRISRLGSASADLDTRVRSTLLSRFRIWTFAPRLCRCHLGHLQIFRCPNFTGNHVDRHRQAPLSTLFVHVISQVPQTIWIADESLLSIRTISHSQGCRKWSPTYIPMTNITVRFFVLLPRLLHVSMIFMYSVDDGSRRGVSSRRRVRSIRQRKGAWCLVKSWKWKRKFGCRLAWYVLELLLQYPNLINTWNRCVCLPW